MIVNFQLYFTLRCTKSIESMPNHCKLSVWVLQNKWKEKHASLYTLKQHSQKQNLSTVCCRSSSLLCQSNTFHIQSTASLNFSLVFVYFAGDVICITISLARWVSLSVLSTLRWLLCTLSGHICQSACSWKSNASNIGIWTFWLEV